MIKQWLRRVPIAVRTKRTWDAVFADPDARHRETLRQLAVFAPYSAGAPDELVRLTFLAARQTFPFMVHLLDETGQARIASEVGSAEAFCRSGGSVSAAMRLKERLDHYGSDKAGLHDYHFIYGRVLEDPDAATRILEIGMGSNNEDVVSNMGRQGKPGASLRAFRDYLPRACIYGADVDTRILFEEDRIKTFFVDQTDLASLESLGRRIAGDFDLIIDDGLHSPNANIAVLAFALKRLKPGGWVVIEDIVGDAAPVWHVVAALLPQTFEPHLVAIRKGGVAFAVRRHASGDGNRT